MKVCSRCEESKELSSFWKKASSSDGFNSWCKSCCREQNTKQKREKNNSTERVVYVSKDQNASKRSYNKRNKDKRAAQSAKYRAIKLSAMPSWANIDEIKQIYKDADIVRAFFKEFLPNSEFHVDHVIPLQGETVCGLHVEDNLQILPATENWSKGNRLKLTQYEVMLHEHR